MTIRQKRAAIFGWCVLGFLVGLGLAFFIGVVGGSADASAKHGDSDNGKFVLGAISGLVTFLVTRYVWDEYERYRRQRSILEALFVEGAGSVEMAKRRVCGWCKQYEEMCSALACDDELRPILGKELTISAASFRAWYSALPLAPPSFDLFAAATILPPRIATKVVRYLDTWNRLVAIEQLYRSAYKEALNQLVPLQKGEPLSPVQEEYCTQMAGNAILICRLLCELADLSLEICREYVALKGRWLEWDDDITDFVRDASGGVWAGPSSIPVNMAELIKGDERALRLCAR